MGYVIGGVEKETDADGYLREPDFSDEAVEVIAQAEGLVLGDAHRQVIAYLRERFREDGHTPNFRNMLKDVQELIPGMDSKALYDLFPLGPAKQGAKVAGLPQPARVVLVERARTRGLARGGSGLSASRRAARAQCSRPARLASRIAPVGPAAEPLVGAGERRKERAPHPPKVANQKCSERTSRRSTTAGSVTRQSASRSRTARARISAPVGERGEVRPPSGPARARRGARRVHAAGASRPLARHAGEGAGLRHRGSRRPRSAAPHGARFALARPSPRRSSTASARRRRAAGMMVPSR